jgi:hypothetical protein
MKKFSILFLILSITQISTASPTTELISIIKGYLSFVTTPNENDNSHYGSFKSQYLSCITEKLNLSSYDEVKAAAFKDLSDMITATKFSSQIIDFVTNTADTCEMEAQTEKFHEGIRKHFKSNVGRESLNEATANCLEQVFMKLEPNSDIFDNFSEEKLEECLVILNYSANDVNNDRVKGCDDSYNAFELVGRQSLLQDVITHTGENHELLNKAAKFMYDITLEFYNIKRVCYFNEIVAKMNEE